MISMWNIQNSTWAESTEEKKRSNIKHGIIIQINIIFIASILLLPIVKWLNFMEKKI